MKVSLVYEAVNRAHTYGEIGRHLIQAVVALQGMRVWWPGFLWLRVLFRHPVFRAPSGSHFFGADLRDGGLPIPVRLGCRAPPFRHKSFP